MQDNFSCTISRPPSECLKMKDPGRANLRWWQRVGKKTGFAATEMASRRRHAAK